MPVLVCTMEYLLYLISTHLGLRKRYSGKTVDGVEPSQNHGEALYIIIALCSLTADDMPSLVRWIKKEHRERCFFCDYITKYYINF